ncbi:ribokinase [Aneurinibacillus sp. Ricciae_BoGa-3]|uniref:ribokinase n=1 Tax=Aneurinibacillus sp. Ricciae_BoGa-3 TaxID=3022697 RepID=UPI0023401105|nr:ribokinase [Aneurinibacillus sp. Ricciae_BoGa-3]WCK56290.1 ribokinase [Aneurinibacillus sp. Ricciae_BoGa-3]
MREKFITVLGSMTMDLVAKTQRRPIKGETVLGEAFAMVPGGKGANQAVTAAKLGAKTYMVGRLGNDLFRNSILDNLAREGVVTEFIKTDNETATGIAHISVDALGDNSIIIVPLANANVDELDVNEVEDLISRSALLMLQLEVPLKTVLHATKVAKKHNIPVILNPAPAQSLPDELYAYIDYLTPNETETEILTGIKITSIESAKVAAKELLNRGVRNVVITLGENGCLLSDGMEFHHVSAQKVEVVDTTAAGDAFNGGMAVGLLKGMSIKEAVTYGGLVGTLAVTKFGAQSSLPSIDEVNNFLKHQVPHSLNKN